MSVSIELHNTGDPSIRAKIEALVEHYLSDGPEIGSAPMPISTAMPPALLSETCHTATIDLHRDLS
jgi:hypothetical protein